MLIDKFKDYDSRIFEGRINTEGSVIGCLVNDPLLLDETNITKDMFVTKDGLFYFHVIKELKDKNITTITEIDIVNNFPQPIVDKFNEKGGIKQLNIMKDTISKDNFDKYLDDLYKFNIYIDLYHDNYNLFEQTTYEGKQVIPIDLFKHLDSEQVIDFYQGQLDKYNTNTERRGVEECELDIDDSFIESCLSGESNGTPIDICGQDVNGDNIYGFNHINQQMNGFLKGSLSMLGGYSSVGKSTVIITMIMALVHRGETVMIVSNEQKSTPFKQNVLMFILTQKLKYYKISKKNLTSGKLTEENLEYIKKAQEIYNKEYRNKIYFVGTPTSDMNLVKKKIREYVLTKGVTTFVYDTFKATLDEVGGEPAWISLIRDSRVLHELARKYDIIGIGTIQLAIHTLGQLFLNANCLSQSKAVKEILENLLLMRNVYNEELDPKSKYYCKPFRYEKNEKGEWKEKTVELKEEHEYRMIFIDKCRSGQNSISGNYAVLIRFAGAFGTSQEYCLCRPKQAIIGGVK